MTFDPAALALFLVAIPLLAAVMAFLVPQWARATVVICLAGALWPLAKLVGAVWQHGPATQALGGWLPPLGIQVSADGARVALLALVWFVGMGVSVYAWSYFRHRSAYFWPLWMFLLAGLNGLIISDDLFNLYVTLEMIGLAAVAMTALTGEASALRAAVRYLVTSLTGSLLYLLGVALTYAAYGSVDIATLAKTVTVEPLGQLALALMTVGLIAKAALFPCHVWLAPAHANAPAPVSALLSALVVKGAFLILVRLWTDVYATVITEEAFALLGGLGGMAVLWGSLQAIVQQRLKMLIAYSTVAQLGYLFLALPLTASHPGAWSAILMMLAAHALAKTALFMAAGNVLKAAGDDVLSRLGPILPRLPITAFAIALAGMSIIGLPPSGGFLGKWLLLGYALSAGHLWMALLLVGGSLLAAIYIFKIVALAFSGEELPEDSDRFKKPPMVMEWAALILALSAVGLGLASEAPLSLMSIEGRTTP